MMDTMTLPYTITRGAQMRLIIPAMLASPFFILAVLLATMGLPTAGQELSPVYYAVAALIPMEGAAAFIFLKTNPPATLTFYPGYVTIKPLPVLGFSAVTAQEHRLADFKAAVLQSVEAKGFVKLSLTRPAGKPLLLGQMKQDTAEQLAVKLGLLVEKI